MFATASRCSGARFLVGVFALAIVGGIVPADLCAGQWYWDSSGTAAGAGDTPSGTWGTSSFWTQSSAGTTATSLYTTTSADTLYFVANPSASSGENPYTITVSGSQSAYSLNYQSSGKATLAGTGTINLWGGGITVPQYAYGTTTQGAVTISAAINVQAAQTWSNNSSNWLLINGSVNNGGYSLSIGGAGNTTLPGAVYGSGGLNKTGGGVLVLPSGNTFTGTTSISGGTLDLCYASALQSSTLVAPTSGSVVFDQEVANNVFNFGALSGSGNLVLQNNASPSTAVTLNVGGNSATTTYLGNLSGSGALVEMGSGILTLSGSNTYSGGTTIASGTAVFTNPAALSGYSSTAAKLSVGTSGTLVLDVGGSGWTATNVGSLLAANSGSFVAGSTLGVDTTAANGTTTFIFAVAGNLGLAKFGANTLSLSAANTFTGTTTVSAGTLNVANPYALQNSTLVVPTVGTLAFDPSVNFANLGGLSGSGNLSLQNGAAIMLAVGGNNRNTVFSGALNGSGALVKYGNGCLCLTGTNTYSGGTVVDGGTLQLGDGTSGHDGIVSASYGVVNNATVVYDLNGTEAYAGGIIGTGSLTKIGGGTLVLTAANAFSGGTTIGSGTLQLGDGTSGHDGSLAAAGGVNDNAALVFNLYGPQTYAGSIIGPGSLTKSGGGMLSLNGSNTFWGTTTMSGGTLKLSNANALADSTLALNSGNIAFDSSVSPASFTLGGLSGSGNISLQNTSAAPVSLTVGGNNASTSYLGALSGSGSLTKTGLGTLGLWSVNSCNGFSVAGGAVLLAGTSSLTTGGNGNVYAGTVGPGALTLQNSASLNVGGNLDVNYQDTAGGTSTFTVTGGSLSVSGKTYIGEAGMRTGPGTTSAAFYQSGGTVKFAGAATVGDNGTAVSLLDINGGSLAAAGGLTVGNAGDGLVNIQGSGVVNVTGNLTIGQDSTLATAGTVSLSSGTLAVSGNVTLGGNGDAMGDLTRSGGAMSIAGNLWIAGASQLELDGTVANVATRFAGLSHTVGSTLVIVPQTGNFASSESVSFASAPSLSSGTSGILGPWAVLAASGTNSSGDYLTASGGTLEKTSYGSFTGSTSATVVAAFVSSTLAKSTTAYAANFGNATTTLGSTANLTLTSGGMILNGGAVTGGTVTVPDGIVPLVYAGSSTAGTISSAFVSDDGLTKFGPGTLVLSGSDSGLIGKIVVSAGNLDVQNALALGASGSLSPVTVAAGASLQIQGNTAVRRVPVTLNGSGAGGSGALQNVQDNNSLAGTINLGSNSQITTTAGTLTLSGPVQGNYALTKTGSGTLVLSGTSGSAFPLLTVAGGMVTVQSSSGLGNYTLGVTVNNGATLQLQGGVNIPSVPLTLNGTGVNGNGALENVQGGNSLAGPVTLAANSQINVDNAADTLTMSGNIGGGYSLTKGGAGTLVLSGNNTFTEALNILSGTLSVPSVNNAGSSGPLGLATAPLDLGGGGTTAMLLYTGAGTTSNRAFTLGAGTAAGSGGVFQVASSLGLNGVIGGNGGLTLTGGGVLTLGASNDYTGITTVGAGTLAISSTGSINSTSDIFINQGGVLEVTVGASGGSQLPDTANITFSGGVLNYAANGSTSPGATVGALLLNPGQGQVVLSNAGSGTPYLQFASGTPHVPGATVGFSMIDAQIEFFANPPAMTNGILPYAFVGPANSTTVDFATLSTSGESTLVSAYSGYVNSIGANGAQNVAATAIQSLTTASSCNALKLVGPASVAMSGQGSLTLESGGLICTGNSTAITGGTISVPAGELIVDTATNLNVSSVISAATALTKTGTATLTLTNTSPIVGNTCINQGALVYAPTGNLTYSQVIAGAGNLVMSGTGTKLTLGGSDTYTGSTTVAGGTLCVNGALAGGGPVTVASGAVLSGSGSIAGSVTISTGTLTLGEEGVGNCLSVRGGVNIGGSGMLLAGGGGAAISGNLNYSSSASSTYSGTILGANSVVTLDSPAGAALVLSGSNQYGGGTILQSGSLRPTNPAGLGTGGLTMSGGTLDLDSLSSLAITLPSGTANGVISKSGTDTTTLNVSTSGTTYLANINNGSGIVAVALANSNSGTLVLSGTDAYTGGTSVYGGKLVIQDTSAVPSGTNLSIGSNAGWIFGAVIPALSAAPASEPATGPPAAVPEPGTLLLLCTAGFGFGLIRLRRKLRWQS